MVTTTAAAPVSTYYVSGTRPVVAGASPTVIQGTTYSYSLGESGTAIYVNGASRSVAAKTDHVASPTPSLVTGQGVKRAVPGVLMGAICFIVRIM